MVITPKLYIALPVLCEYDNLKNLNQCLVNQTVALEELLVCVNQYESWWDDEMNVASCEDNLKSIEYLQEIDSINITIIDKSTRGNGWHTKKGGVGWARKIIMDRIADFAKPNDIIISIDADTYYPPNYFEAILNFFKANTKSYGLAIPYYHNIGVDDTDKLILRYEIYMRYYLLNMLRINNPFAFTAIGSAMAFPVWAYKMVGGLTPVAAGEDFYFLQKLSKSGSVGIWTDTLAYPSSRFSSRVAFGTGPALIKGKTGLWDSYPIYNYRDFDIIESTYALFKELFYKNITTPMDDFLELQFKSKKIWDPIRNNYKDKVNFEKACTNKIDGLRLLQFLKWKSKTNLTTDEQNLKSFILKMYSNDISSDLEIILNNLSFDNSSVQQLNAIRDFLFEKESHQRKQYKKNRL